MLFLCIVYLLFWFGAVCKGSPDGGPVIMGQTNIQSICRDNHPSCPFWGQHGECQLSSEYMMTNCAFTCNSCQTRGSPNRGPVIMGQTNIQSICTDNHPSCPFWGQHGECHLSSEYMMTNCAFTCNSCRTRVHHEELRVRSGPTETQSSCRDNHPTCSFWGQQGECQLNPEYMLSNCAFTCKSCNNEEKNSNAIRSNGTPGENCTEIVLTAIMKNISEALESFNTTTREVIILEAEAMATSHCEYSQGCNDLSEMCSVLFDQGRLSCDSSFMLVYCPKSCDTCLPLDASECFNKADKFTCELSAALGLCEVNYAHNLRKCSEACRMAPSIKENCAPRRVFSCDGMKTLRNTEFECGGSSIRKKRFVAPVIPEQTREGRRMMKHIKGRKIKTKMNSKGKKKRKEKRKINRRVKNSNQTASDTERRCGSGRHMDCQDVLTSIKNNKTLSKNITNSITKDLNNQTDNGVTLKISFGFTEKIARQSESEINVENIIIRSNNTSSQDYFVEFNIIGFRCKDTSKGKCLINSLDLFLQHNSNFNTSIIITKHTFSDFEAPNMEELEVPAINYTNSIVDFIIYPNFTQEAFVTELKSRALREDQLQECSNDCGIVYSSYIPAQIVGFLGSIMPMTGMMAMSMMGMPMMGPNRPEGAPTPGNNGGRFNPIIPPQPPIISAVLTPVISSVFTSNLPIFTPQTRAIPSFATLSEIESIPDNAETREAARTLMPFCDPNGYLGLIKQLQALATSNNGNQLDPEVAEISRAISYCRHGVGEVPSSLAPNITKDIVLTNTSEPDFATVLGIAALGSAGEITENDRGRFFCGASLITPKHILTAAHCIKDNPKSEVVRLGERDFTTMEESQIAEINIKKINVHPGYELLSSYNDIAVIELEREVIHEPYCIPPEVQHLDDVEGTASGWGSRPLTGPSNILVSVNVTVTTQERCNELYNNSVVFKAIHPRDLDHTTLCAAGEGGDDVCTGDSGGPLVMYDEEVRAREIGIVSQGRGCGSPLYPGIYTRIDAYLDWLDEVVYGEDNEIICSK